MELTRDGPGLLLRDIRSGEDAQVAAVVQVLVRLQADAVLLTNVDWDHDLAALKALAAVAAAAGADYPVAFALRPNTGVATGLDLDGDGRRGGPGDAQGWGRFAGAGGMALLSRLPLAPEGARDLSGLLWRDLPGAILPPDMPRAAADIQRLSSAGHWVVPLAVPGGKLTLMAFHATPPVFDGPGDRNGRRNHDEAALWTHLLDGDLGPVPEAPFVLLGTANLDPVDGEGRRAAITALLSDPRLQDPAPRGTHGRAQDPGQTGDPAMDTALFAAPGGLRTEILLPSSGITVTAAGVLWPPDDDPFAQVLAAASRHRPVWVDLDLPAR